MSRHTSPAFRTRSLAIRATALASAVVLLAACGSETGSDSEAAPDSGSGRIAVVATTNVYASIVSAVGGDAVNVTAILDSPAADPHSFEATPTVALQISDAQLLVMNGGGYDDFAATLVAAEENPPIVIDAVEVSGVAEEEDHGHGEEGEGAHPEESAGEEAPGEQTHAEESHAEEEGHEGHAHGEYNEHVFYNLDAMVALSTEIAHQLGAIDPAVAAAVDANAATFVAELADLRVEAGNIGAGHPGTAAVTTESVIDYLLDSAGIENLTPSAFSAAVENETDPSVSAVADVNDLLNGGTVALLAQNLQTSGPVIDQIVATAAAAGVPVVGITETFPEGVTDYVTWIRNTLTELSTALDN